MFFKINEGMFSLRSPNKGGCGGGECGEWCCHIMVVLDKLAIEMFDTQKTL